MHPQNGVFNLLGLVVVGGLAWAVWIMLRERFRRREASIPGPVVAPSGPLAVDFAGLEQHFGFAVHPDLIWLYGRVDIVQRSNVFFRGDDSSTEYEIDHFLPATPAARRELWFEISPELMPIAIDGAGNYFAVNMSTPADNLLPVLYVDHDGGATWEVAHSIRAIPDRLKDVNANPL